LITAIVTILVFLVMITLHEFGHFASAKILGVKVLEFSVGMGPALIKHQGKKTLYSFRIFPIGGYCKLEGENGESSDPEAFSNQKLWKRMIVVVSGAFLNIILGIALFGVIVKMMSPISTNVIDSIEKRSYLADTDVAVGDKIVAINGHNIDIFNDIYLYTNELNKENGKITVTIKRDNLKFDVELMPSLSETKVTYGEDFAEIEDTINGITEKSTVKYNKEKLPEGYLGKTFTDKRKIIGFAAKKEEITWENILPNAWNYTKYVIKSIYQALWELVSGRKGLENLSGPIGVAGVINDAVNSDENTLLNILFIVAMLTVNLGIFNLLPLPALDGGRLLFMLIELVTRKKVPPEKEGLVHTIGLVLLLMLAVVVFYSDIMKLVR